MMATMPRLSLNVARLLALRMRKATQQLHLAATARTEERVAFNLFEIARLVGTPQCESVQRELAQHASCAQTTCLPVSIQDLASMSGCSREQLHRVLERMQTANIVERTHGRVRILDFDALKLFGKNVGGGIRNGRANRGKT